MIYSLRTIKIFIEGFSMESISSDKCDLDQSNIIYNVQLDILMRLKFAQRLDYKWFLSQKEKISI